MNVSAGVTVAALIASAGLAVAQPVSIDVLIAEGDALDGSTVTGLGAPRMNGNGQVGVLATLADDRRAVWLSGTLLFTSDQALPDAVTGGESDIGIGNNGEFIYSPSFNGSDAVWGQDGLIAVENTPAPDFDPIFNTTFHSRPFMTDDGTAYWVSGINDGQGGTSSLARQVYKRDPVTGAITTVLRAGDLVDGVVVATGSGIDFDFHVSSDNSSSIFGINAAGQSTSADGRVLVNGNIVAGEGFATGQGDNWDNFDNVAINNLGNYLFSGDTDGSTSTDEFIAYNGAIQLREGDSLAGGTLSGFVDGVMINNNNEASFIWDLDGAETLFYSADASDLASSVALLSVGDEVDVDGDGNADWILDDFNAFGGPDIAFREGDTIAVSVDLESLDGTVNIEAIISVVVPAPGSLGVLALGGLAAIRRRR